MCVFAFVDAVPVMVEHTSMRSSSSGRTTPPRTSFPPTLRHTSRLQQVSPGRFTQSAIIAKRLYFGSSNPSKDGFIYGSFPCWSSSDCQQHSTRAATRLRPPSWASCRPWSREPFRLVLLVPHCFLLSDPRRGPLVSPQQLLPCFLRFSLILLFSPCTAPIPLGSWLNIIEDIYTFFKGKSRSFIDNPLIQSGRINWMGCFSFFMLTYQTHFSTKFMFDSVLQ